ncbi:uncharacterized protein MONOS_3638 [Monocercomonoides exilis]|uniref:uncharacterized protein n=1 Tax=Monocercomonoides exilis TaxID=2049356 RepID=UPI003559E7B6|nr:hypothetical protein MONOS_3638 [Monocercomonoides exilis]|eukprot:MONOS_3638.1-p1 / transcript=MONOS_3638.1 / gene=MONOS_3638 / organism=Monocercomonoides_exilis_PA203 / gene_product=unspecified product / transcript_product=unspecified product / location=Mono_scaffold00087:78158-78556(+) / protein_length=132 / sequence_SO=supercontig / SO=protein_coding / is_pseudo=false
MAYASDGDKLYIFGGISESGFRNDLWEFDIQSNQWKELEIETGGVGPEPCGGAGMLVSNGYAIVYGGDASEEFVTKLKIFWVKVDASSSWSWEAMKIADVNGNESYMPDSRSNFGHATFIGSNKVQSLMFGG